MAYATATINSVTPAKDLMAALGTTLTSATGGMQFVETYGTLPNANWTSVAYGAGVFVAVASGTATAATSTDGITWTQRSLPATDNWKAVTFGGGLFVTVANSSNLAATSPDGVTWTLRTLPGIVAWTSVAYGAGTFVAVAQNATAASSLDGVTWTVRTLPALQWSSVVYGAGLFVAVNSITTAASTSPDGITWTPRTTTVTGASSVAFGAGLFVVVNLSGTAASTSPDGVTWTSRTLPASATWTSVTYSGNAFVAVASGGTAAATSTDGINWGTVKALPVTATWSGVAYGAGVFAAVASSSSIAASSPDGSTWTQRVLTTTSASAIADVYKSPAASNQFGQDWYLILKRNTDYGNGLFYQVAEGYSTATHKASNYGGTGVATIPTTTTYVNSAAAASPETVCPGGAPLSILVALPFTYWVSATANRFVLGLKTSTEQGIYAGLYDDLLPAGTTQFPLVCVQIPNAAFGQVVTWAIGGGSLAQWGGFTREPGQAVSSNLNFEARIHNGWQVGLAAVVPGGYTPSTSTAPQYGNPDSVARVMLGTGRATTTLADGLRGLLIGCVTSQYPSVCGDTITAGGKTYVRLAGPALTAGIFVDTAL
jgi:hypothetical protein